MACSVRVVLRENPICREIVAISSWTRIAAPCASSCLYSNAKKQAVDRGPRPGVRVFDGGARMAGTVGRSLANGTTLRPIRVRRAKTPAQIRSLAGPRR
jgi:hypothetical protein